MKIVTERLIISEMTMDMAMDVHRNSLDEDVRKFVPDEVFETPEDAEETIAFIMSRYGSEEGPLVYAVLLKETHKNIGYVQLVPVGEGKWEIGYHIAKDHTGKGFATEAVKAFLPAVTELVGINEVYGIRLLENTASGRVLEKCGFRTVFTGEGPYHGGVYEISRSVWEKQAAPAPRKNDAENSRKEIVIRKAEKDDARQIADILVEDWKTAYRGIIDDDYLDSMNVEERYRRELQRYGIYRVAAAGKEILGFTWNEIADGEASDCELIALYVRYAKRKSGIGRALFQDSADFFRAAGRKKMIVWCLRENGEARKFYERMGGKVYKTGTHKWGNRDYEMISYLYQLDE